MNSWVGKKTGKDGEAGRQHGENWKQLDTTISKTRGKTNKFLIHTFLKRCMPNQTKNN